MYTLIFFFHFYSVSSRVPIESGSDEKQEKIKPRSTSKSTSGSDSDRKNSSGKIAFEKVLQFWRAVWSSLENFFCLDLLTTKSVSFLLSFI